MLETLIFRQYRYDNNIENQIKLLEEEIKQDNQNIDKLKKLAEIYHAYKTMIRLLLYMKIFVREIPKILKC